jgi:hypothetical protein
VTASIPMMFAATGTSPSKNFGRSATKTGGTFIHGTSGLADLHRRGESQQSGHTHLLPSGTSQPADLRQGELVRWSTADNGIVRHVRDQAGIRRRDEGKPGVEPVDAGQPETFRPRSRRRPHLHHRHSELLGTDGETYSHGLEVYMGSDTQTVTVAPGVGGVKVGGVHLPNAPSRVGAVRIPMLIDEYTRSAA